MKVCFHAVLWLCPQVFMPAWLPDVWCMNTRNIIRSSHFLEHMHICWPTRHETSPSCVGFQIQHAYTYFWHEMNIHVLPVKLTYISQILNAYTCQDVKRIHMFDVVKSRCVSSRQWVTPQCTPDVEDIHILQMWHAYTYRALLWLSARDAVKLSVQPPGAELPHKLWAQHTPAFPAT